MFKIICYGNPSLYIINEGVNDDNETAAHNDALHQLYLIYAVLSGREGVNIGLKIVLVPKVL